MRIHLHTICWNESRLLGFFFRHYDPWVERYVIYDDGSQDGTLDQLRGHPKVEVRPFPRVRAGSYVESAKLLHNSMWKESRGKADWVIISAIDEHLWHQYDWPEAKLIEEIGGFRSQAVDLADPTYCPRESHPAPRWWRLSEGGSPNSRFM